jgi:outer membrane protein TolC
MHSVCVAQIIPDEWTVQRVVNQVRQHHPIVKQANLLVQQADAERLAALGNLDPVLSHTSANKTLNTERYYNYHNPELSIPTWIGADIIIGAENLSGTRTDPMETPGNSSYVGINIPLAKGLLLDKRRATLQKARIYSTMSLQQQRALVNDVVMESIAAYWRWVEAEQIVNIVAQNVAVTSKRFDLVKKAYANGERPAIDTIEVLAQLQSFELLLTTVQLHLQQAKLAISAYLWNDNATAITLNGNSVSSQNWQQEVASNVVDKSLEQWVLRASANHPELSIYDRKKEVLNVEKKLAKQNLLPKLDFRYNQLGKNLALHRTLITGPLFVNNNQWSIKASMPLLFREAKGNYKATLLALEQNQWQLLAKKTSIQIKVQQYYAEYLSLQQQIALQEAAYKNYTKLVSAEERKFFNGESSIFLINSRETKALEAYEKLISLKTKLGKIYYALMWAAGELAI